MAEWTLANEYPATSMPSEADAFFARNVAQATRGGVSIDVVADARGGRSSHFEAVTAGETAMANMFAGALAGVDPIFGLSTLPFTVRDAAQARTLFEAARPSYEKAFARHDQKLLYATPWPASGLWTRTPAVDAASLAGLRIRTYDPAGAEVFRRLGATANAVAFADLPAKLASGETDAVLSSGDGGAGRKLWDFLPRFTEINYAIPLSFATVNRRCWEALDSQARGAVEQAASRAEAAQWKRLEGRVASNYARMREHGMTITAVSDELRAALQAAAAPVARDWARSAGPEAVALLESR